MAARGATMANKPTILIAGGAGFLGSHLCDHYLPTHDVVCVDNLATGRRANLSHLEGHPGFTFIAADVSQPLPSTVTARRYDIVANLASPASPPHYQRLALETLLVGSAGTLHLLDLARASRARFFQASTSEVYGDPEVHPQPETYWGRVNSYGPRSMYDEAKRYAEALIYAYRRKHNVSTTMARIFNTYGPRMDPADGRVVSNFIVQALHGKPLTVYGEGEQTRSFCYVSDLIAGIAALIASDAEGPVNLGNPGEFTIRQLADHVIRLTGSGSRLTHKPLPTDDPTQRRPDITRARELLSWQPHVQLEAGLKLTIEYFQSATLGDQP
jgi:nucleoside-diphosphate-sugar epimerase